MASELKTRIVAHGAGCSHDEVIFDGDALVVCADVVYDYATRLDKAVREFLDAKDDGTNDDRIIHAEFALRRITTHNPPPYPPEKEARVAAARPATADSAALDSVDAEGARGE